MTADKLMVIMTQLSRPAKQVDMSSQLHRRALGCVSCHMTPCNGRQRRAHSVSARLGDLGSWPARQRRPQGFDRRRRTDHTPLPFDFLQHATCNICIYHAD